MRLALRLAFLLAAVLALAACSEKEQVAEFKRGKYQGKPDNQSWANDPLPAEFRGGSWSKGDRTAWEEQIKKRQLAQHEYRRIYQ
jgi:hypothetical protein